MEDLYSLRVAGEAAWLATFGSGTEYVISQVFVPQTCRGAGLGTWLLEKALEDADRQGVTLRLQVEPDGVPTLDRRQLRKWYGRHGFRSVGGDRNTMERAPKKVQETFVKR